MEGTDIFNLITQVGGLAVLAGALLTGMVMTKGAVEAILKERDRTDAVRDARLEDQKAINRELTEVLNTNSDALARMADAWEARNRADAEQRRNKDAR